MLDLCSVMYGVPRILPIFARDCSRPSGIGVLRGCRGGGSVTGYRVLIHGESERRDPCFYLRRAFGSAGILALSPRSATLASRRSGMVENVSVIIDRPCSRSTPPEILGVFGGKPDFHGTRTKTGHSRGGLRTSVGGVLR